MIRFAFLIGTMAALSAAQQPGQRLRALLDQARRAEQSEDLASAAAAYREILRIKPGWAAAELNLGLVLAAQNRNAEALDCFRRATSLDPSLHSAQLGQGVALFNLERYGEAIPPLERYAAAKPEDNEVWLYLARTWAALGDHARAIPAFREQLRLTPAHPEALYYLGESARLLAGALARQLADDPGSAYFFTLLSAEEPGAGHESRVRDAIEKTPNRPEAYVTLGLLQLRNKQNREAAESFQQAWKRDSADCRISTTCTDERDLATGFTGTAEPAAAYAAAVRARRIADTSFRKLVSAAPSSPLVAQAQAHLWEQNGDLVQAERHYREAMEQSGRTVSAVVNYAKFLARQGAFDKSAALLREALRKDPASPVIMALAGEVLFVDGSASAALPYLQAACNARPADEQTRSYLAQSLVKLGRTGEAIRTLASAPADPSGRLHFQLGTLYRKLGQTAEAERAFAIYRERRTR